MCIYGKCKKVDIDQCTDSCYNIVGTIKDSISGVGIAGVQVEIATVKSGAFPIYTGIYGIVSTDNSGFYSSFYSSNQVNFIDNHLSVTISAPIGYISDYTRDLNKIGFSIFKSDSIKVNIPFRVNAYFYKKAYLNIRVIKATTTNSLYSFGYQFGRQGYGSIGTFPSSGNTDTTYKLETAAEIKTYLKWQTKNGASAAISFSDSAIIQPGQTKNIVIQL